MEISRDGGGAWTKHGPLVAPEVSRAEDGEPSASGDAAQLGSAPRHSQPGIIQPTVWEHEPGCLKMLVRARNTGRVCAAGSEDCGRSWSPVTTTAIPHSNSGLDAVYLGQGRAVLVCNPTHEGRTPLSILYSGDNGETWSRALDLEVEPGEYSYPSVIECADGLLHIVYTYRRTHIQHATLEPSDLTARRSL